MHQRAVGLTLLVALCACVKHPVLSPAAENVRMLVKAEPESSCKELGSTTTGNDWFKTEEEVKIRLRNLAAEMSANVATLDVLKQDGSLWGGSGRAFRCP
jgi:hypothetical protein